VDLSPRTFGNEDHLPRVPLPTLGDTCDRFLEWCTPLLGADELAATTAAVTAFRTGPGPDLQAALDAYDHRPDTASWLDAFWAQRYLGRRDRIALNANFFFLFEDAPLGQIDRAARFAAAAVAYKRSIDDESLPPATARGRALSMEQNKYLFSATRIPGDPRDTSRNPWSDAWPGPSQARHIVVLHDGNPVGVDVIAPDGRPYAVDEIAAGLRAAVDATGSRGPGLGHLTTKARAEWAASRRALLHVDPGNATALDTLETALFCLCLEDSTPESPLAASDQLLHGDSGNRWFDKSVSLIVFADGTAGYNGEHCNLDGTTVIGFLDAALEAPEPADPAGEGATPAVAPLGFVLDDALRADVRAAGEAFAAYAADTATATLSVDFSAERAKALKCSPDAFAQMAFQLAHVRAKGHVGATYESIATRAFKHGRTEAMRVVTPEILAFTAAMDGADALPPAEAQDSGADALPPAEAQDSGADALPPAEARDSGADDPEARRSAFRAAADKHVTRAKECQAGLAPEQHLWELQLIASRRGDAVDALYGSPGWTIMRDDYLSTSAVPSPHVRYWGFGSTSEKCIGVGYAMLPERFDLYLSTPRAVSEQMAAFASALTDAVRELEELLTDD